MKRTVLIAQPDGCGMDLSLLNDAARAAHLLGLALGFGVAIVADFTAARSLVRPLDSRDFATLHSYHRTVSIGLMLFWVSGMVLLWLRTGLDPANFSPKLLAKLGVVSLLTVNAILIGRIALPMMKAWSEVRFGALPLAQRLCLAMLAGISSAGWVSAIALGVFSAMKTLEWGVLSALIGGIYAVGLGTALIAALFSPFLKPGLDRREALRHEKFGSEALLRMAFNPRIAKARTH
jgi:hypothetical protein